MAAFDRAEELPRRDCGDWGQFIRERSADSLNFFRPFHPVPGWMTSSAVALKGLPGRTVYSATKAAIRSFARTWIAELKGRNIRVNVLSPGPIATPGQQAGLTDEKVAAAFQATVVGAVPMARVGQSEEMAEIVAFLASDASSYINGADIQADGGWAQIYAIIVT